MALKRLHQNLLKVRNSNGQQNQILLKFADHIMDRVLLPSGRCVNGGVRIKGMGGHFIYDPRTPAEQLAAEAAQA